MLQQTLLVPASHPWLTSQAVLTYFMLTASYPKTLLCIFLLSAFFDTTEAP